jgi:hypothetical protein
MREFPQFGFAVTAGRSGSATTRRAVLFPQSGHAVLRARIDPGRSYRDNSQLVMNVGPPRTAHAHLDALAFSYYSNGRELLVDSGLYTYSDDDGRSYFFGTRAHNTVVVDGQDQIPGPVLPGLNLAGDDWAYQSGSATVNDGVTHRRSVLLLGRDLVLVADTLTGTRPHEYEQLWHIFPEARVITDGQRLRAYDEYDNVALRIEQVPLAEPLTLRTYYGQNEPTQGWYSAEFGRMQPNHVGGYRIQSQHATYLTLIASEPHASAEPTVTGTVAGGSVDATVCADGVAATVAIRDQAGPAEQVSVEWSHECPR